LVQYTGRRYSITHFRTYYVFVYYIPAYGIIRYVAENAYILEIIPI